MRLAGANLRRRIRNESDRLDDDTRLAVALCVADIAAMNTAIAETQWTRNKAALALYHRTVGVCAQRLSTALAGAGVSTARRDRDTAIGVHRAELDRRAVRRLEHLTDEGLETIANIATRLRTELRNAGTTAWTKRRPRHAVELRTTAVYALHIARWAREVRRTRQGRHTRRWTRPGHRDGAQGSRYTPRRQPAGKLVWTDGRNDTMTTDCGREDASNAGGADQYAHALRAVGALLRSDARARGGEGTRLHR